MAVSIRTSLIGIMSVISLIGVGFAALEGVRSVSTFTQAATFELNQRAAARLQDAAGKLAVERGRMAAALASRQVSDAQLADIRAAGQAASDSARLAIQAIADDGLDSKAVIDALSRTQEARKAALASLSGDQRDGAEWFRTTTATIDAVLNTSREVSNRLEVTPQVFLTDGLSLTEKLALTAENMGRQRGLVAAALNSGKPFGMAQMRDLAISRGAITISLADIDARAEHLGPRFATAAADAVNSRDEFKHLLDSIVQASDRAEPYPVDAATWFATATKAIEGVQKSRLAAINLMQGEVARYRQQALVNLIMMGALVLVCIIAAGGGAWVIATRVLRPMGLLGSAVERFSREDYAADVACADRSDEMGALARSIDVLKARGIEAVQLRAAQAQERQRAEELKKAALEGMAQKVESETRVAVDEVARQTGEMQVHADAMAMSAALVSTNSQSVAAAATQALQNAETVAAAAEQLSSSIREIASQVSHAGAVSSRAVAKGEATQATIAALSETVAKVSEVTSLIAEIAAQTNLLALNATIEAARAGEAGKGFAVVAGEVKNLAGQTARATEEISRQISAIEAATHSAVDAVGEIGRTIAEMDEISSTIAAAVEEQGAATQEISRNVIQAAEATREVTTRIGHVSDEASQTGDRAATVRGTTAEVATAIADLRASLVRVVRTSMVEVDRRADPRIALSQECTVTVTGKTRNVRLSDLSRGGARLTPPTDLAAGQRGSVRFPGVAADIGFECLSSDDQAARLRFTANEQVLTLLEPLLREGSDRAA